MNKDKHLIKFATFREQPPTTYTLSKCITKDTKRHEFKEYCVFYGLDFEKEAQRVQRKLRKRFSWYGKKIWW